MVFSLLLVHSPLVGPSSLAQLADVATSLGHRVALPDLTSTVTTDSPHDEYVSTAAAAGAALPEPRIVVGHSGAGAFLPLIAEVAAPTSMIVFVDAVVPPPTSPHRTSARLVELLDDQTVGDRLRPWLEWWPDDVVAELLPDPADRAALRIDLPRVPRSFYDCDVPVPAEWVDRPCGYVQLSAAYEREHADAEARGWPTLTLDRTHLAVRTDPGPVFDAIAWMARQSQL